MIACICHNLNDRTLRQAVQEAVNSNGNTNGETDPHQLVSDVQERTGTCTCCGRCAEYVAMVITEETGIALPTEVLLTSCSNRVAS